LTGAAPGMNTAGVNEETSVATDRNHPTAGSPCSM
jgi:hypothetical protein